MGHSHHPQRQGPKEPCNGQCRRSRETQHTCQETHPKTSSHRQRHIRAERVSRNDGFASEMEQIDGNGVTNIPMVQPQAPVAISGVETLPSSMKYAQSTNQPPGGFKQPRECDEGYMTADADEDLGWSQWILSSCGKYWYRARQSQDGNWEWDCTRDPPLSAAPAMGNSKLATAPAANLAPGGDPSAFQRGYETGNSGPPEPISGQAYGNGDDTRGSYSEASFPKSHQGSTTAHLYSNSGPQQAQQGRRIQIQRQEAGQVPRHRLSTNPEPGGAKPDTVEFVISLPSDEVLKAARKLLQAKRREKQQQQDSRRDFITTTQMDTGYPTNRNPQGSVKWARTPETMTPNTSAESFPTTTIQPAMNLDNTAQEANEGTTTPTRTHARKPSSHPYHDSTTRGRNSHRRSQVTPAAAQSYHYPVYGVDPNPTGYVMQTYPDTQQQQQQQQSQPQRQIYTTTAAAAATPVPIVTTTKIRTRTQSMNRMPSTSKRRSAVFGNGVAVATVATTAVAGGAKTNNKKTNKTNARVDRWIAQVSSEGGDGVAY